MIRVIIFLLLTTVAFAQERIPIQAKKYKIPLRNEYRRVFGLDAPPGAVTIGAGTIHQESRWNPLARSSHAQGLTQFTPLTWVWIQTIDKSISAVGDVWNPSAAIRAMARYHQWLWIRVSAYNNEDRWAFVLSGYNGGSGWVIRDRALCRNTRYCKPDTWFGNVEKVNAGRTPAAIMENRVYVYSILKRWRPMYAAAGYQ